MKNGNIRAERPEGSISTSNKGKDDITFAEFLVSEWAQTPLGKLYRDLLEEKTWSEEFSVYASFGENPFLQINHRDFPPECSYTIIIKEGGAESIREVEESICAQCEAWKDQIEMAGVILMDQQRRIDNIKKNIPVDKCRAALLEKIGTETIETHFDEVRLSGDNGLRIWKIFGDNENTYFVHQDTFEVRRATDLLLRDLWREKSLDLDRRKVEPYSTILEQAEVL